MGSTPAPDPLLIEISDYVVEHRIEHDSAYQSARLCLLDALGCAVAALDNRHCRRLLGPLIDGVRVSRGARVPGTSLQLDPVMAAFNIGCMIRWLDYNDTFLAAEWGHPSDNLGAILACADFSARRGRNSPRIGELLRWLIKAYEIQGVLALENRFNALGLDHVILVRIASAAVATAILGGDRNQVMNAVSNAWLDGAPLRLYRQGGGTGWRKSWAAGDATSRGVFHALLALRGEMGYPQALSTPRWGFQDVVWQGRAVRLPQKLSSYVVENILFKVSHPAEFHAQTAVECALRLRDRAGQRIDEIERIVIETQRPALRIIHKTGPLRNPADRDHCLQYVVAVALLYGSLTSGHYEDPVAADPRIESLRKKMVVQEDPQFTRDYDDPARRAIPNRIRIQYRGGRMDTEQVDYPLGHRNRRAEAVPLLLEKFARNVQALWPQEWSREMIELMVRSERFCDLSVDQFMARWVSPNQGKASEPPSPGE